MQKWVQKCIFMRKNIKSRKTVNAESKCPQNDLNSLKCLYICCKLLFIFLSPLSADCDERKLKGVIYFQAIEEIYFDHLRTAASVSCSFLHQQTLTNQSEFEGSCIWFLKICAVWMANLCKLS